MANTTMGFGDWLRFQVDRDDPVGDIARDLLEDQDAPRAMEQRQEIEDYLHRIQAAWNEWSGM